MFRKALFVLLMFVPCIAFADTIYLKNGRAIKDVEAIEDDSFVKYYKIDQEISIPKSQVDRVEKAETQAVSSDVIDDYKFKKEKERDSAIANKEAADKKEALIDDIKAIERETDYDDTLVSEIKTEIMSKNKHAACNRIQTKREEITNTALIGKRYAESLLEAILKKPENTEDMRKYSTVKRELRTYTEILKMLNEMERKLRCD